MRDNINVNSSLKLFESYRDFSGGLNTEMSNEMMRDNQVTIAENVDLALTSSIKKRTGRTALTGTMPWTSTAPIQGLFKFVNNAETVLVVAVNGRLYFARPSGTSYGNWTQINITDAGSAFTFQTTDTVEAVQYANYLYVATGTKLVRCQVYLSSGSPTYLAETVVDQYKPSAQEALYIGMNGLNTNPSQYIVDSTTGSVGSLDVLGIGITDAYFSINVSNTLTCYVKTSATDLPNVQYAWSYRLSSDTAWTSYPGYHPHNIAYKALPFNLSVPGTYDVKCEAKLGSTTDDYIIYGIVVASVPKSSVLPSSNIQKCRKILLHWDRLILYDPKPSSTDGTTNQQDQIFISHVGVPSYFPQTNVISFSADTQQRVRKIVRYRNILLVFTPDTVQSLAGKSPSDYVRSLVNNQMGALWANSVQVVENDVFFVSKHGMYAIRPNVYTQDNFNVMELDTLIEAEFTDEFIVSDGTAELMLANNQVTSAVFEGQYYLYGVNRKIYRHYYDRKTWVVDDLSHLALDPTDYIRFITPIIASFDGEQTLIEPIIRRSTVAAVTTTASTFYALDKTVYTDATVPYTMRLRTKYFDLSQAFNYKKLRQLFIITRLQDTNVELAVTLQADSSIILNPDVGTIAVSPTGAVTWTTSTVPNFTFLAGTFPQNVFEAPPAIVGNWIAGINPLGEQTLSVLKTTIRAKCRRVRLEFEHSDPSECEVYGFGLEFRSKKP